MAAEPPGKGPCHLCDGAKFRIWERPLWSVYLNENQNLLGKVMVAVNRHTESVFELTPDEWAALRNEVRMVEDAVDRLFHPDRYNLMFLMNAVPHVHLHVVPRYLAPRSYAGETFDDPDYGSLATTDARRFSPEWLDHLVSELQLAAQGPPGAR